jgi:hypothetical protein
MTAAVRSLRLHLLDLQRNQSPLHASLVHLAFNPAFISRAAE